MGVSPIKAPAAPGRQPQRAPVPPRRTAPRPGAVRPKQRALVVDRKNMLLMWLEEKIARKELTPEQADKMLKDQGSWVKDWVSPIKDAGGSAKQFQAMAKDFGTWKGARVKFTTGAKGVQLVTFSGWPNNREMIRGTRYRVNHPKMIELQIGKPGLVKGAVDSARFGVYLVVAVDVLTFIMDDKATWGSLLGALTYDIPGVILASAVGAAAGAAVSGTALGTALVVGSFAMGPIAVAFVVGFAVGYGLSQLDKKYDISGKLGKLWDQALAKLAQVWDELSDEAEVRYRQFRNSRLIHDLDQNITWLSRNIGRQADAIGGKIASFW